jgi:hypothetical protein
MSNELSYQQETVYNRLEEMLKFIRESFNKIRAKGTLICGASTTLVGVITAAEFLPDTATELSVGTVLLGMVCLCSVVMYHQVAKLWRPSVASIAGSTDTDILFDQYLSKDAVTAYNNFLIDLSETVEREIKANTDVAFQLERIVLTFQCQIGLLAVAILWPALSAFARWTCVLLQG